MLFRNSIFFEYCCLQTAIFAFFAEMKQQKFTEYDYLIIGQGIAGTVLSYSLIKRGYRVMVVNAPRENSSSKVAAGVYNPVVLKRLKKIWRAEEQSECAALFYRDFEQFTGRKVRHELPVYRIFHSVSEQNRWMEQATSEGYRNLLSPDFIPNNFPAVKAPYGYGRVLHSGWVDINTMLAAFREYLLEQGCLVEEAINYKDVEIADEGIQWKQVKSRKLVFCEGHSGIHNPWFGYLPLRLTKGELVTIKAPDLKVDRIVKGAVFILPQGDDLYRIGATFNWHDHNEKTTEAAREELLEKFHKITTVPYEVIDQQAGIRPTVIDRRPLLGLHPEHPQLGIFNGLGTRGVLWAPYLVEPFIDHMEEGSDLEPEVDIRRFEKDS